MDAEARVYALFEKHFRGRPQVVASAPGRVNLIGEHTDYNGGEVLPIAIDRRTWAAVGWSRMSGSEGIAVTEADDRPSRLDPQQGKPNGQWTDYIVGMIREMNALGCELPGVHLAISSDVPGGAGLSSSAALEMAVGTALLGLSRNQLLPIDLALAGNRAENAFVGVASGIMDQFASALARAGHALHLRCDTVEVEQVPFGEEILIFDTAVPRSLVGSAFNTRRAECSAALELLRRHYPELPHLSAATADQLEAAALPEPLNRRAAHVVHENRRVRGAVKALRDGHSLPGDLLLESHESLRRMYECSTEELDWFVDFAASTPGVSGARLTGAGWGGCAIAVGTSLHELASLAPPRYRARFGRDPRIWITRAGAGVTPSDSSAPA